MKNHNNTAEFPYETIDISNDENPKNKHEINANTDKTIPPLPPPPLEDEPDPIVPRIKPEPILVNTTTKENDDDDDDVTKNDTNDTDDEVRAAAVNNNEGTAEYCDDDEDTSSNRDGAKSKIYYEDESLPDDGGIVTEDGDTYQPGTPSPP